MTVSFYAGDFRRVTIIVEYDDDRRPAVVEFPYPRFGFDMTYTTDGGICTRANVTGICATVEGPAQVTELGTVETPADFLAAREAKDARR